MLNHEVCFFNKLHDHPPGCTQRRDTYVLSWGLDGSVHCIHGLRTAVPSWLPVWNYFLPITFASLGSLLWNKPQYKVKLVCSWCFMLCSNWWKSSAVSPYSGAYTKNTSLNQERHHLCMERYTILEISLWPRDALIPKGRSWEICLWAGYLISFTRDVVNGKEINRTNCLFGSPSIQSCVLPSCPPW